MGIKALLSNSTLGHYVRTIRSCPRELIFNRQLLLTVAMYAMSGIPISKSSSHPIRRPTSD